MEFNLGTIPRKTKSRTIPVQNRFRDSPKKKVSRNRPGINRLIKEHIDDAPIVIEYNKNYPIEFIHHKICKRLETKIGLDKMWNEIDSLTNEAMKAETLVEQKAINHNISKLRSKAEQLENGKLLDKYLDESQDLIHEFLSLGPYVETISFDSEGSSESPAIFNSEDSKRLNVIERYINVAKKYAEIDAVRTIEDVDERCINCGFDMSDVVVGEVGEQVCPECQTTRHAYNLSGHQGIKKNKEQRRYDVVTTFSRELVQFQGQEKVFIPPEVYEKLDQYFMSIGLPPATVIKTLPLNEYGKRERTSLKTLIEGLKSIGYNTLYKNANLIGKNLWGWELHDLKDLIPLIMDDFNVIQKQYSKIDRQGRSSNICSQHRLLQQLRLRGVKVDMSDFKLPGKDALEESEEIWRKMIEKTDFPYIPLFPDKISLGNECTLQIVADP